MSDSNHDGKALQDQAQTMKSDWNDRARENAMWFINTVKLQQTDDEFDETGRPEVERFVLADVVLTKNREFKKERLLEIGCGIGRMTRHLSRFFAEVHGTDVSGEMIRQGRERLRDLSNVTLHETSGVDFSELPSDYFDIIFSVYVFQHVPSADVIHSNIGDACRVLKPGGLFKFQTCSITHPEYLQMEKNTWAGASFSESDIRRAASDNGVRLVSILGLGTQYCWTILNKPPVELSGRSGQTAEPKIEFFSRSDSPHERSIPNKGDYAFLTLIVSGFDHRIVDANSMTVEFGDGDFLPCYTGWLGAEYEEAMRAAGRADIDSLTQINIGIPPGYPTGKINVRVRYLNNPASEPVALELIEAPADPPKITLVSNDFDGGVDVYAQGDKSRFRVFAAGMDESASPDNVCVIVGDQTMTPASVSFIPGNAVHMAVSQMPGQILPGEYEVKIKFHDLVSESARIRIL